MPRADYFYTLFYSMNEALKMEQQAKRLGIPGRLVPTPRGISGSCGMSWRAEITERSRIEEMVRANNIRVRGYR
ncbi:MAG: DUF3343 domain-containing protein [Clostridia bacterium]|nr:DUF3343 domain-containing protein [Clostridia bacterium]